MTCRELCGSNCDMKKVCVLPAVFWHGAPSGVRMNGRKGSRDGRQEKFRKLDPKQPKFAKYWTLKHFRLGLGSCK